MATPAPTEASIANEVVAGDLPISFQVKYLGSQNATGLWGIKHTRRPIDHLVAVAKILPPNKALPQCCLTVSLEGVTIKTVSMPLANAQCWNYAIDSISYGVQDTVYSRVFSMIIVKENYTVRDAKPFEVHAFVCDNRALARKLTYSLAASFQEYSKRVKDVEQKQCAGTVSIFDLGMSSGKRKKFAIDLRTPEQIKEEEEEEQQQETEA